MQVDAFAARLRGYEELAVLLEKLNGSQALIHVHRAIDHVDLVIAIALGKLLNDIGLRAAVFGKHQHPLIDVPLQDGREHLVEEGGHLVVFLRGDSARSEEHTSELTSLMRISYAVFCLQKKYNNSNAMIKTNTRTQNH